MAFVQKQQRQSAPRKSMPVWFRGHAAVFLQLTKWPPDGRSLGARVLRRGAETLVIALTYYILARVGLQLEFAGSQATPVWPPSGFAFAALLLWGMRAGGGVFLGALCANITDFFVKAGGGSEFIEIGGLLQFLSEHPVHIAISALIAAGNTLEAVAGWYLVGRFSTGTEYLKSIHGVLVFCATTPVMCAISSTVGVTSLVAGGVLPAALYAPVWFTWWLGDITGILIVTPFVVAWCRIGQYRFDTSTVFASALVLLVLFLFSEMTFNAWFDVLFLQRVAYFLFPILLFISFRFSSETATAGIVLVSAIAVLGTTSGTGPFIRADQNESLIILQGFVSVVSVTVLFLTASIFERRQALDEALRARDELELRVEERTAQLEVANRNLRRSNLELEEFASIASHDLKEPLRKISAFGQLLNAEKRAHLDDEGRTYIDYMVDAALRMRHLIEDLLDYSQVASGPMEKDSVNLERKIPAILQDLAPAIDELKANITVGALPTIDANASQMRQLFQNLIGNALKFHSKGRALEIRISSEPAADGKSVTIAVVDNGIGFDAKYRDEIFKPFRRLHNRSERPGAGMGLAICRKIAERHGGSISATGTPGQGAVIEVCLPLS